MVRNSCYTLVMQILSELFICTLTLSITEAKETDNCSLDTSVTGFSTDKKDQQQKFIVGVELERAGSEYLVIGYKYCATNTVCKGNEQKNLKADVLSLTSQERVIEAVEKQPPN